MKVEQSSFKIFLTSGITLTVKSDERIMLMNTEDIDIYGLNKYVSEALKDKKDIRFTVDIKNIYKDEDGNDVEQTVFHHYHIPYDKISWFMIEAVEEVEENN